MSTHHIIHQTNNSPPTINRQEPPPRRYPSSPSSTASSESDEDTPGPDPPRRGDDRNLRINSHILHHPTAPALATPSTKIGSHPWPFNSLSPRLNNSASIDQQQQQQPQPEQSSSAATTTAAATTTTTTQKQPQQQPPAAPTCTPESGKLITTIQTPNQPQPTTNGTWKSSHSRAASLSSSLPHEILIQILRSVSSTSDLRRALLVCKAWCQCGIELLWHKPTFPSTSCLIKMLVSLASKNQTFPYISFIRRLNFSGIADHMTDHILLRLVNCTRLERLTLSGCNSITDDSIIKILKNSQDLVALDLSDCKLITDECIHAVGQYSKFLQGLNLSGCKAMTDAGLQSLRHCKALRRLKLKYCEKITDAALTVVAVACPLLLEVDLVGCRLVTNASLWMLWKNSSHLRELSLSGCTEISDGGFPNPSNCNIGANGISHPILEESEENSDNKPDPGTVNGNSNNGYHAYPYNGSNGMIPHQLDSTAYEFISSITSHRRLEESVMHFDHIRFLDLTSLVRLTDASLDGIIKHMPRIRNLVLAKCGGLTDEALNSICGLGKYLHYLHLGHVSSLTDRAVIRVARSCTRLRYIDLACCNNLTDMSVFELAQCLPRLKRIGLVRVTNITDQSVYTLVERTSLERIHLSYCDNITVGAIHWLLQRLQRLTHLSLTGVPAFRRTDLQAWCRAPPKDFNAHQRQAFCVYSGKGVSELRYYLAALYVSITSSNNRSRVGPTSSNNSSIDEETTNNMTLSAAPIGPNLSVFNSMPDPRTMAAAMAAARQQTNPQLYGMGSRRRELRLPERGGRVALSDFLHQGPSTSVNSAVISGNGQLLSLPDLPRHPASRMFFQFNNDNMGVNALLGVNDRSVTHNDEPSTTMQVDEPESDSQSMAGSSSAPRYSQSHGPEQFELEVGNEGDGLRSPIPLYGVPNTRLPPFGLRERSLAEHNQLNGASTSTPSSRTSRAVNAGPERVGAMVTPEGGTQQYGQNRGPTGHDSLRIPNHSITRRRSDVDMASGAGSVSARRHLGHHDTSPPGSAVDPDDFSGSANPSRMAIGLGPRTRSNGINLNVPDRTDSVSPIEISDDERPPP
ncbi:SCF ubiquitin ligase complex subunit [Puccinia graminis f. sp. tritici]|uniref:SCF ubiquitin ligase complex subunit n=1 Tax=Puccinia graminis f. sp. tritici TaxID=56615 RepID=A0A5B0N6M4_PUCGR|nr:SCF ubiquitin ligase complex subunit [Puccinia graminis f. sp. tritici]KAA1084154.1 SCF ubiquitin ligase complex subunit [Puccinia graminis f. sp. tritici]